MFETWVDILLRGTYEEALPTLTLSSTQTGETTGSGRLIWRGGDDLRIQAATRRIEEPGTEPGTPPFRIPIPSGSASGELIPHSTYLTGVGQTQGTWTLRIDPRDVDGFSTSGAREIVWNFTVSGVCFSNETSRTNHHSLRFLLSPCPDSWTRFTHTKVENEFFGGSRGSRDWMMCLPAFGKVAAKQRSDDWFEVFVEFNENTPERDPHEIVGAISRAFSFYIGRQCVCRGYEYVAPGKTVRRIDVRQVAPTLHSLRQPLGRHMSLEPALGPTIDFFLTETGLRVAQYLFLCWDTADNAFATQQAISSICIEGMLRVAAERWGPKQGGADKKDENIQKLIAWLETKPNPIKLTDDFIARVTGMVNGMLNNKLSAKDIQRDWVGRSLFGGANEEFRAWSDTRQPLAHGSVGPASESQADLQVRIDRHSKILNLLNKMVLGLVGYTGEYIDYSQRGWPAAPFPAPLAPEGQ